MYSEKRGKKFGLGSLSLIICILTMILTFTSIKTTANSSLGQYVFDYIGMPIPFEVISLLLFCLCIFMGNKYKEHLFSKVGKYLAISMFLIPIIVSIIFTMMSLII